LSHNSSPASRQTLFSMGRRFALAVASAFGVWPAILLAPAFCIVSDASSGQRPRLVGGISTWYSASKNSPPACITSDSTTWFRVRQIVSGSDTALSVNPRRYDKLPHLPADSVTFVTDTTLCRRAAIALGRNLRRPDTTTLRSVSVLRVGATRYVVTDPALPHPGSEWMPSWVFDSTLTRRYVVMLL